MAVATQYTYLWKVEGGSGGRNVEEGSGGGGGEWRTVGGRGREKEEQEEKEEEKARDRLQRRCKWHILHRYLGDHPKETEGAVHC